MKYKVGDKVKINDEYYITSLKNNFIGIVTEIIDSECFRVKNIKENYYANYKVYNKHFKKINSTNSMKYLIGDNK